MYICSWKVNLELRNWKVKKYPFYGASAGVAGVWYDYAAGIGA
ncbi:hypothetical protein Hdeb2414_s0012g00380801 [Helianthus debilis subsp. tardiflorus]